MKENIITKHNKVTVIDLIQYICAVIFCIIPFIPFVDEMTVDYAVVNGDIKQVTSVYAHMVLTYVWYGYLPILVAVLVVISAISKNKWMRIVMLVANVGVAAYLVILANIIVAKIFEAGLYEPTVGYYLELVAAVVIVITTLSEMVKEYNKPAI